MGDEKEVIVVQSNGGMEKVQEAEQIPKQYEIEPVDVDYEKALARLDGLAKFMDRAREIALKSTESGDWAIRTDKNGKATVSLMGYGAERILSLIGIEFLDIKSYRQEKKDEDGKRSYEWYYEGFVKIKGVGSTLPVLGSCSSKDDFFASEWVKGEDGKAHKELKPMSEVDEQNIRKSALTNFYVNGATRILGIRNVPIEKLEKLGLKRADMLSISYKSGKPAETKTDSGADAINRIGEMLMEMAENDKEKASKLLEKFTEFKDKEGKPIRGIRSIADLNEKRAFANLKKIEQAYKDWQEGSARE